MKAKFFFHTIFILFLFGVIPLHSSECFGEKISVVAGIFPVTDMVKQVGGEYVDVTTVIPAGASPHTFEPKPSLVKTISTARIFFIVGAGLEFWAEKFAKPSGNQLMTVVLSEGVSLIHTAGHHHHDASEHHHSDEKHHHNETGAASAFANPHIWLDPVVAKSMVEKIVSVLCLVDNTHLQYYEKRGKKYLDDLDKLHCIISTAVEKFSVRKYVAFHPAWDYFAKRYGLVSVGVIETSPGKNPTPKHIKNIISLIRNHNIRAVFAEPQLNSRVAEVIAREANVKVLLLDPMGGSKLKGRNTYIDLMKYNLKTMQEAML